jgi:Spy/CpxP family protein refolding chaperone
MTVSRFSLRMMLAGVVIALAGATAVTAFAHGRGGHDMGQGGPFMGRMSERMLDHVDATPEQRAQVRQITEAAAADLKAQRETGRALHQQAMDLFKQPTVDANAAEALRQQMLAQHDQASKRMLQAMLDVSRVLSPEQRAQLAERMAQRRQMMQHRWQERTPRPQQ